MKHGKHDDEKVIKPWSPTHDQQEPPSSTHDCRSRALQPPFFLTELHFLAVKLLINDDTSTPSDTFVTYMP
jgi:hypothetical protein